MKKNVILLIFFICIMAFNGMAGSSTIFAAMGDVYYFDDDNWYFDLDSLKNVESSSQGADIRFQQSGSACYLRPVNGASIKSLGKADYEKAKPLVSGYTSERVAIVQEHVYAVKSENGSYAVLKVTGYNGEQSNAEFIAKLTEPERRLDLYYMNGDNVRFDLETMKNVSSSQESDIYFRCSKTTIEGENGSAIKDMGTVSYESAKAPLYGYSNDEVNAIKDHVYAIKSKAKCYIIKITNVVSESDVEFIAKVAEQDPKSSTPQEEAVVEQNSSEDLGEETNDPEEAVEEEKLTDRAQKKDLYWVENGVRFILSDKILFEDSKGVMKPFLSPNKKYVVYSNGSYNLLMYDIAKKTKKVIYSLKDIDYGIYAVGWSQDNKQVAFMTSYTGGFTGGNQLCILNLGDKKISVVAKGLSSADWGKNGKFAIANGKDVWLVDKVGRNKVTLKVPTARAFFGADKVSFTSDCTKVIYIVAEKYYLHDLKSNKYKELPIDEEAAQNGTVRAGKSGKITVVKNGQIYIYDPTDDDYGLLYKDADSSYPNWVNG